jgi:hypothetical protein
MRASALLLLIILILLLVPSARADTFDFRFWDEMGVVASRIGGEVDEPAQVTIGGRTADARFTSTAPATMSAVAFRLRFGFGLGPLVYVATDFHAGGITHGAPLAIHVDGATATDPDTRGYFALVGVIGGRERIGPLTLAAELAVGGRSVDLHATAAGADVWGNRLDAVVETRARAEWWIAPHFVVAGGLGTSVRDTRERSYSLAIGWHLLD